MLISANRFVAVSATRAAYAAAPFLCGLAPTSADAKLLLVQRLFGLSFRTPAAELVCESAQWGGSRRVPRPLPVACLQHLSGVTRAKRVYKS